LKEKLLGMFWSFEVLRVRHHLSEESRNCSLLGKTPASMCCRHEEVGRAEPDACRHRTPAEAVGAPCPASLAWLSFPCRSVPAVALFWLLGMARRWQSVRAGSTNHCIALKGLARIEESFQRRGLHRPNADARQKDPSRVF